MPMYILGMVEVRSTDDIVNAMEAMARKYASDMDFCLDWPIETVFQMLSHLPYVIEPAELRTQILQRPKLTLAHGPIKACANKAICFAAWCLRKGYPFQFVVSTNDTRRPYSHVYLRAKIEGVVVPIDATYFWNCLADEKRHAATKSYPWRT